MEPSQLATYTPPTGGVASQQSGDAISFALAAQAKAAIEARYIMAMRNPRDWDVVRDRLLRECKRPGFAASAIYHKPVGGGIEGASIRFVESAIRCMTNILPENFAIYDDVEKRIVRVSVTDLEANLTYTKDVTITKTVERRSLKKGEMPLKTRINSRNEQIYILEATDDDILNKENALISKALRTLGLRILPGDIHDEAMALCRRVRAREDAKDPAAAKRALFDSFSAMGVSADMLKEYLGHKGDVLAPKELEELRGLYAALKDGETTWREIIDAKKPPEPPADGSAPPPPAASAPKSGGDALKAALGAAPAPVSAAAATPAPSDPPAAAEAAPAQVDAVGPDPDPVEPPAAAAAPAADPAAAVPPPADGWLSESQEKLLFAMGKKQNPICDEHVVRHVIKTLNGMEKAKGKPYFDAIADAKPDAQALWSQARQRVAEQNKPASAPPPPPPPPPSDPDGFDR